MCGHSYTLRAGPARWASWSAALHTLSSCSCCTSSASWCPLARSSWLGGAGQRAGRTLERLAYCVCATTELESRMCNSVWASARVGVCGTGRRRSSLPPSAGWCALASVSVGGALPRCPTPTCRHDLLPRRRPAQALLPATRRRRPRSNRHTDVRLALLRLNLSLPGLRKACALLLLLLRQQQARVAAGATGRLRAACEAVPGPRCSLQLRARQPIGYPRRNLHHPRLAVHNSGGRHRG